MFAVQEFLATYGWYLLTISVAMGVVYYKYVQPSLEEYKQNRYVEDIKKFDQDSRSKHEAKMQEAREKQFAAHKAEAERKAALARERALELAEKEARIPDAAAFVQAKILGKKVVVFSKKHCPFCAKAKQAFSTYWLSSDVYEIVELDDLPTDTVGRIQQALADKTGGRTVPRVFIDAKFVGGGDEVHQAMRDGRLEKWLRDAGAL